MTKAYIRAISYYLPERVMTNEELVKEFPEWSVDKVAQKVGVYSRHLAGKDETAGDMAEKAARKLFEEYHIDPQTIDFLLLCTQTQRDPPRVPVTLYHWMREGVSAKAVPSTSQGQEIWAMVR